MASNSTESTSSTKKCPLQMMEYGACALQASSTSDYKVVKGIKLILLQNLLRSFPQVEILLKSKSSYPKLYMADYIHDQVLVVIDPNTGFIHHSLGVVYNEFTRALTLAASLNQIEDLETRKSMFDFHRAFFIQTMKMFKVSPWRECTLGYSSNYNDEEQELLNESEVPSDELYDHDNVAEFVRQRVRGNKLPMAYVPPIKSFIATDAMMKAVYGLMKLLIDHHEFCWFNTYFASHQYTDDYMPDLHVLMTSEFYALHRHRTITDQDMFIHRGDKIPLKYKSHYSVREMEQNLKSFVGSYLDELDLSSSFITGSAIAASCFKPRFSGLVYYNNHEDMVRVLYPPFYTDIQLEADEVHPEFDPNMTFDHDGKTGVAVINGKKYQIVIRPGADVDIAIDDNLSIEEYEQTVQAHFEVIKRHYPYVKLDEVELGSGRLNYRISTDDPEHMLEFRTVELYQSSFNHICTHHVGIVRGAYTAYFNSKHNTTSKPAKSMFYFTSSCIRTMSYEESPNYHYFAGKKSKPQDVIIKYMSRGIRISDRMLDRRIHEYCRFHDISAEPFVGTFRHRTNLCLPVWHIEQKVLMNFNILRSHTTNSTPLMSPASLPKIHTPRMSLLGSPLTSPTYPNAISTSDSESNDIYS